jgi:hypothetical protein
MTIKKGHRVPQWRDVDNLALISMALMALCSAPWVQVFNLGMIAIYGWAHRADWHHEG